jgi:hypothetical protein
MTTDATRCIDPACNDGPPLDDQPAPRYARVGLLCPRCALRLERRLAELPARHDELGQVLGGSQGTRAEGKRTKGAPPVPLNVAAHDHRQHMTGVLASWALLVREERGLRGPDTSTVAVLAPWLVQQTSWLVEQPWVDDLSAEVADLTRVADGITRRNPGWHRLPAPCPECAAFELGRKDGDSHVECRSCGLTYGEADYLHLVHVLASDEEQTVTAREGARLCNVKPETFRQWVTRGWIRRMGEAGGLARYSREDVERRRQEGAA